MNPFVFGEGDVLDPSRTEAVVDASSVGFERPSDHDQRQAERDRDRAAIRGHPWRADPETAFIDRTVLSGAVAGAQTTVDEAHEGTLPGQYPPGSKALLQAAIDAAAVPISVVAEAQRSLTLLLHPFAPYLAHELWEMIGEKGRLLKQPWPQFDPELAKEEEIEIVVQVNGKIRSRVLVAPGTPDDDVRQLALNDPKVTGSLDGKQIVKAIVVPNKLVNIVVR